ncbi:TPA: hypothetical protein EYP44_04820, partial [Candidatus Bathyarchaeota archaeon]|nr:hypothetical protein [Candidatus Bathyarchaeota archaeon]
MRVAWVYPPMEGGVPQLTQNRFFKWTQSYDVLIYPVIPASACTLLKSDGFDVRYIDAVAMRLPWDELASRLSSFAPDLVLMEAKTPVVRRVWRAANGLKSALPDARVALCGDHVSVLPRESLERCRAVDYVITGGDFDLGALKLAKALRDGDGLPAGLWYRGADGVATTGRFELAEDLDSLPFIDRELVPWQPYHESWRLHDEFFYIMSGRGCMYRCTFCMSGDAALVIREEGRIAVKTVSDLFAKVEERDPILFGEDELVEVGDKGLYVWSDGGFVRLRRVSRRPADGELYRVITREGRNVLLSRRHRVPVRRDGREILLHAEEIRPGDHIKVMRRLPTPGRAVGWISLLEEFARLPTALLDDVYVRNVSGFLRRIGYARGGATVPRSTRYRRAREGIVPIVEFFRLLRAYGVGTEELAVARLGVRGSTMSVPLFYPVTGELLRLLGYFVAEGHYNGYSLVISTARQEVRRDVLRIVPKVFTGSFITEWVDTRKETGRVKGGRLVRAKLPGYQIYFGGKVARLLFERAFGIPGSARRKRVPDVVFNLPEELQGEFLRGLFTGDGSLRSDGTVGFSSRSRILRQGVSFLLTRLGVEHNLLEERDGSYGDLLYRIKITSWDGRQRFLEKIGFMDVRRQGDL